MNALTSRGQLQLSCFDHGIIHRKVNQIIGCDGFTRQDRESLKQELTTRLLQALNSFDASKAHRNVFATTVVERSVANIVRDKRAIKRDHRRICSLNVMVNTGDNTVTELSATIGQEEYDARRCRGSRSGEQRFELEHDIEAVLSQLPEELRDLAEQLKHKSLSQIARELNVPRTTLRGRLYQLRQQFEAANMRFHL